MESYIKYLKLTFLTIFLFIFNYASFAAPAGTIRDSFDIFRWYITMTITANNNLYLLDKEYGVFKADLKSKIWKSILNEKKGYYKELIITGENNLFVSADLSDTIFHSQNKGQTWEKISIGISSSIHTMCSDNEKYVWILDYKDNIYFTEDNGKSWAKDSVFKHTIEGINDCNIINIKYDKEDESLWIIAEDNHRTRPMLFRSVDKGLSFAQIPTPADQIKDYDKKAATGWINISSDGDYYYVHQNNIVSKTRKDHIEWKIVDEKKPKQQQFPDCYGKKIGICSKNDTIWYYTDNGYLCNYHNGEITATKMSTETPINIHSKEKDTLYNSMTYYNGIYYYARYKSIYCKDGNSGNWYRYLDSDKAPQYVWKDHNGVYMCDENFNKYQINQEINSIKPYVENLADFKDKRINKVIIEKGTIGCEDGYTDGFKIVYKLKNEHFIVDEKTIYGEGGIRKEMPRKITKSSAENLLQYSYRAMCGIIDTIQFELTDKDLKLYKEEIDTKISNHNDEVYLSGHDFSFANKEDYDFIYDYIKVKDLRNLSSLLDRLKITQDTIHTILTKNSNISATDSRFNIVHLILNDGSWLKFENNDIVPNYLCCPWIAFYNGEPFLLKSLAVGKSIDDMTNGKFMPECNTKEYAIGKILRYYLYNQKQ